eukprot:6292392-Lingulodinium_polyedra.AAC.1
MRSLLNALNPCKNASANARSALGGAKGSPPGSAKNKHDLHCAQTCSPLPTSAPSVSGAARWQRRD